MKDCENDQCAIVAASKLLASRMIKKLKEIEANLLIMINEFERPECNFNCEEYGTDEKDCANCCAKLPF